MMSILSSSSIFSTLQQASAHFSTTQHDPEPIQSPNSICSNLLQIPINVCASSNLMYDDKRLGAAAGGGRHVEGSTHAHRKGAVGDAAESARQGALGRSSGSHDETRR